MQMTEEMNLEAKIPIMKLYETMHAARICCWPLDILDGDKIVHILSKRKNSTKSCFSMHMQGVFFVKENKTVKSSEYL